MTSLFDDLRQDLRGAGIDIVPLTQRRNIMNAETKKSAGAIDAHVGKRVRIRRVLLGMSQTALANQLGVTFQQLQKNERGDNRIGASRLFQLATILDVPVGYFFEGLDGAAPDAGVEGVSARRETLELCRNVSALPVPVQKQVRMLVKSIADQHMPVAAE